jgi:NodT family efflux transporter outer membrane factor (OMF) lipoprotein
MQDPVVLPDAYRHYFNTIAIPSTQELGERWWESFQSLELNDLVAKTLENNIEIQQARTRLVQALALAKRSYADLIPSLDMTGQAKREENSQDADTDKLFSVTGVLGYELDIWGKNRTTYRADHLEVEARLQDIRFTAMAVTTNLVKTWLRLQALYNEKDVLQAQINTNRVVLDLQQKRYANGAARVLSVLQQAELLASVKTQLPTLESEEAILKQQMTTLVGNIQLDLGLNQPVSTDTTWFNLPIPSVGLPSRLLQHRPDVQAAWFRLLAADWASVAVKNSRLPTFTLSLNQTTSATQFNTLFDHWLLSLLASVTTPIFDGGSRRAQVLQQSALADERLQNYRKTVLDAVMEVEGALARNDEQQTTLSLLEQQLQFAEASLRQVEMGYNRGHDSYTDVLLGLSNVQSLQRQILQARRDLLLGRIDLYQSLGLVPWTEKLSIFSMD